MDSTKRIMEIRGSRKKISNSIKVLFITTLLDKMGGSERNLIDTVLNTDRTRFTPYVLAFRGGELVERLKAGGITVEENGITRIISVHAVRKGIDLYQFIKRVKIDIVVTYHHDADIWGSIVARLSGVPVVISSRRDMGYQLSRMHIWFYRVFSFLFDSFISVSDAVKKEIEGREWIRPEKVETVYNGLWVDKYSQKYEIQDVKRRYGIDGPGIIIGMVASFRPVKGHIYLVEAVERIVRKFNNTRVLFVGYTDTDCFRTVKKRIDESGLSDYFIFTGQQQNVAEILSIMDIFVMSSINEGFSNAILEAMAAGKPVIAADSGGNPEAVLHGRTGFLFRPCDSQSLACAIERMIADDRLRQSMGVAGKWRVEQGFQFSMMMRNLERLYWYHLCRPSYWKSFIQRMSPDRTYSRAVLVHE